MTSRYQNMLEETLEIMRKEKPLSYKWRKAEDKFIGILMGTSKYSIPDDIKKNYFRRYEQIA